VGLDYRVPNGRVQPGALPLGASVPDVLTSLLSPRVVVGEVVRTPIGAVARRVVPCSFRGFGWFVVDGAWFGVFGRREFTLRVPAERSSFDVVVVGLSGRRSIAVTPEAGRQAGVERPNVPASPTISKRLRRSVGRLFVRVPPLRREWLVPPRE